MACLLGVVPDRYKWDGKNVNLETYFAMARGSQTSNLDASALEMTKWFDTNYHYLVPELKKNQVFKISSTKPFDEFNEAKQKGYNTKPILIGPLTFLFLSKTEDGSKTINLLDKILPIYKEIIKKLSSEGAEWIQIDEPYLVKDLDNEVISKIKSTLNELKSASGNSKLLVTSYFESLDKKVFDEINNSSIDAIHLDLVRGAKNIEYLKNIKNKIISLGVVDGRNIWKSNLNEKINLINNNKKDELFISSSCPLLHTPYEDRKSVV